MPTDDFFEPLSEEEINFCWRCLVDQGALSVSKLQHFFEVVTGEKLSVVQAKDLRNYMDADSNGNVGMEDFKNFMSVQRLKDTDVKSFMWTPNQKWRSANPGAMKEEEATEAKPPAADTKGASSSSSSSSAALEPKPPPGQRTGPARPAGKASSKEVAAASLDKKDPPGTSDWDAKQLAHIAATIEKYEQESWVKFLEEEETFKKHLFDQFASEGDSMGAMEYHKMLTKWSELSRWCLPSSIQPGDSLAVLDHLLSKDRELHGGESSAARGQEAKLPYRVWQELVNGKLGTDKDV